MRPIKFRAYWKPGKVMISSQNIESINFETKVLGVYYPIGNIGFQKLRMSDFELMQWTGLNDSNGVPIYEGDRFRSTGKSIGTIEYIEDGFKIVWDEPNYGCLNNILRVHAKDGEIIGNRYENSELINS